LFFLFFGAGQAKATANVWGWAWSENIGWISFNKDPYIANGHTVVTGGGGSQPYGVTINPDGTFTGYAWSENIGWIRFDPPGPYPDAPSWSAKVSLSGNQPVTGWARACSVFQSGCSGDYFHGTGPVSNDLSTNPYLGGWMAG